MLGPSGSEAEVGEGCVDLSEDWADRAHNSRRAIQCGIDVKRQAAKRGGTIAPLDEARVGW